MTVKTIQGVTFFGQRFNNEITLSAAINDRDAATMIAAALEAEGWNVTVTPVCGSDGLVDFCCLDAHQAA